MGSGRHRPNHNRPGGNLIDPEQNGEADRVQATMDSLNIGRAAVASSAPHAMEQQPQTPMVGAEQEPAPQQLVTAGQQK